MNNYILKIDCADAKGLIYKISDVLYKSDLNIGENIKRGFFLILLFLFLTVKKERKKAHQRMKYLSEI